MLHPTVKIFSGHFFYFYRAWIKEFSEDGQCEVFFIDWGNISKQSRDNLTVIKDIHWTMRPQIVLFRMSTLLVLLLSCMLWKLLF